MSAGQQVLHRLEKTFANFFRHTKSGKSALLHEHVTNTRHDFWHKATTWLVNTYGSIGIEELKLGFMLKNKHLSQSAHDARLGLFTEFLHSKAESAGCMVMVVNPKNTSQACSGCGVIVPEALSVRVHHCPHCNLVLDRDENAARNIYFLAFKSAWTVPSGAVT
jgi:putative transposase